MRLLAIDLGDKRTGLAVGDDETGLVSPLTVLAVPRGPRLIEAIARHVAEHVPDVIVLGLPLNMDGTAGKPAESARAFGSMVGEHTGCPIVYQDERLTSFAAETQLAGRSVREKKRRLDALAAAEILRDYLDEHRPAGGEAGGS